MNTIAARTPGLLQLSEVRDRVAAALAPQSDDDPEVFPDLVDALTPPAFMVIWADPWMQPRTVSGMGGSGRGYWDAWVEVIAVVSRVDPTPSLDDAEALVSYALDRLANSADDWPVETFYAPRNIRIGDVPYFGARMVFRVPVTI